jgi:hypothetical protein
MIKDPDTGKRVSRPNPASEWQSIDAPYLRIIDQDQFAGLIANRSRIEQLARVKREFDRMFQSYVKGSRKKRRLANRSQS